MPSNLKPPAVYRVRAPIPVYLHEGYVWSNTWVGRSQASSQVYRRVTLSVGALVRVTYGGIFTTHDGCLYTTFYLPKKEHVFEHGMTWDDWPLEALSAHDETPPTLTWHKPREYARAELVDATTWGRMPDYVLPQDSTAQESRR